ncbi:MAG TPA: hypothetical protein VN455_01715 [Methanotrichaceae archaeon]|nr:hypothetical protein [Methanotrichaceae archaeon]
MMKAAKGKSKVNSFFISRETGEMVSSAWRDDKAYFPDKPKNTYEVHIRREPFMSYSMLDDQIEDIMCNVYQEDEMETQQLEELKELASYSDDVLKYQFGFSERRIAGLRELP